MHAPRLRGARLAEGSPWLVLAPRLPLQNTALPGSGRGKQGAALAMSVPVCMQRQRAVHTAWCAAAAPSSPPTLFSHVLLPLLRSTTLVFAPLFCPHFLPAASPALPLCKVAA